MTTMITDRFESPSTTVERLNRLAHLEQTGQASLLMARTIDKLFAHEIAESRNQLTQLQADLSELEVKYALKSADFYQRYLSGQVDDRMDFIEWASLIQMFDNLQKRLDLLTGEKVL